MASVLSFGPFYGAIAFPSVTRCRCCRRCCCGHRCAGGVWQWRRATVATPGEWQCKIRTGGVRRLVCGEWAQHFSNASCLLNCSIDFINLFLPELHWTKERIFWQAMLGKHFHAICFFVKFHLTRDIFMIRYAYIYISSSLYFSCNLFRLLQIRALFSSFFLLHRPTEAAQNPWLLPPPMQLANDVTVAIPGRISCLKASLSKMKELLKGHIAVTFT